MNEETKMGGAGREFHATAWTQILNVRDGSAEAVQASWEHLLNLYWKPVYFQIRRKGHSVEDAKDLTQQFFYRLMEREALKSVDPAKGKFRSFLLVSLRNFLNDEYDRRKAAKRQVDYNYGAAEAHFDESSSFERDWATTVLDRAFARLREISPREARVMESQRLGKTSYRELAEELQTAEANIKVMAHRGKKKLRAIILEELKETVSQPGGELDELEALFQALS